MYIRTECGTIMKQQGKEYSYISSEKKCPYNKNDCDVLNNHRFFINSDIKSQGDNLIDVLEDYDTLIELNDNKIVSHMSYKSFKYFYEYGISLGLEEKMLKKYKVITHEQYMPLKQEVK